jgi:hypothetical protein
MRNHLIALAAALALAVAAPAMAIQTAAPRAAHRHDGRKAGRLVRQARARIGAGVLSGRISDGELATLRSEIDSLRGEVRQARRNHAAPTDAQRQQIRAGIRQLRQDIRTANSGDLAR